RGSRVGRVDPVYCAGRNYCPEVSAGPVSPRPASPVAGAPPGRAAGGDPVGLDPVGLDPAGVVDDFFAAVFLAGAFLAGAFVAAVFVPAVFFAGAFFAADFLAGAFLAGAFVAAVFVPAVFFAGAFFAADFLAGAFLRSLLRRPTSSAVFRSAAGAPLDSRSCAATRNSSSASSTAWASGHGSETRSLHAMKPTCRWPSRDITVQLRPAPWNTGPMGSIFSIFAPRKYSGKLGPGTL